MSRKRLFAISLLLPLVAASATAYAGTTISDKRYWPNEARPSAPASSLSSSFTDSVPAAAMNWIAPHEPPAVVRRGGSPLGRYQGGPKSR
jgi:hypothetical protein